MKKNTSNSQNKFLKLLPQRIACYLTAYFNEKNAFQRIVHFEVFNVHQKSARLNTPFPNNRSEKRKIPVAGDPTVTWHEEIVLAPQVPSYSGVPGEAQFKKEARLPGWFSTVVCQG